MYKKLGFIAILLLSATSITASAKEMICHKNNKSVLVSNAAVSAHLGHGDTLGACGDDDHDDSGEKPDYLGGNAAVVMMRCEAINGNGVELVAASSSVPLDGAVVLPIPPVANTDCADVMASLLNAGFDLQSATSGGAEDDLGKLHLYTDYLLFGEAPKIDEAP